MRDLWGGIQGPSNRKEILLELQKGRCAILVLTRKKDEDIVIETSDGPVIVKVIRVGTNYVSIGIDAPKTVKISRGEHAEDKQ